MQGVEEMTRICFRQFSEDEVGYSSLPPFAATTGACIYPLVVQENISVRYLGARVSKSVHFHS